MKVTVAVFAFTKKLGEAFEYNFYPMGPGIWTNQSSNVQMPDFTRGGGEVNPFTPKSDLNLISPCNNSPESNIKVMRIKEMITNQRSSWLLNKFSLSEP